MKEFATMKDILDFAIAREQNAVDFYTRLSSDVNNSEMRDVFIQFAKEEMGHKAFLEKVKIEGSFDLPSYKIVDIKIADYSIPQEKDVDKLNYPESLVLAMRREKAAYDLYKKIAASVENQKYAALFESLAQEELKHKNRFETEYDDFLSKEN